MVTSVANSIHTMLVTPQKINYNCSVGVAYFTLVCVEEDIDTTPARVSRFYGMVQWNGTVEWNSGMVEWWSGGMS